MYQDYDNAVAKINKYITENHFSISVIYSHLNCYRLFKQYLEEKYIPYSYGESIMWLTLGEYIRQIGINLSKLSSNESYQMTLFD